MIPTETARTILVHEWVTGGGLAGSRLARLVGGRGSCAMRRTHRGRLRLLAGRLDRVIVTSDARLPDDPGPWTTARIAAQDDTRIACESSRRQRPILPC